MLLPLQSPKHTHYTESQVLSVYLTEYRREYNVEKKKNPWDFPGGAVVKNPPANAGNMGSIPGLGRSHMLRSN